MAPRRHTPETTAELRSSLIEHARLLIAREGPDSLTMRALAAEAGCALGLPYKVFADRRELVGEILSVELERLVEVGDELVDRAGEGNLAANLAWYAAAILDSPAVALAGEVMSDEFLADRFAHEVGQTGRGPGGFQTVLARYLAAEHGRGRVAAQVDVDAVAFFLAGAVHNLVVSGPAYPRPGRNQLAGYFTALADLIRPR